jgi:hypothetical protein
MSQEQPGATGGSPTSSATQPSTPNGKPAEVVVISHSTLFYWWPVWLIGFIMAGITYLWGYQVAFVPRGTVAERNVQIKGHAGTRDVLVAPEGRSLPEVAESDDLKQPQMRMAPSNNLGILWALTLCLVVVFTNVPLRGLWSVIVMIVVFFLTVLLAILGLWDPILRAVLVIDIHITACSYLAISLFLFVIWLVAFLFFDRLKYMVFTRGQLRVRMAISQGETVFDTRGMVVERHRDDLFRHWLLGFGSGDLTVRTGGGSSRQLELPNVLFISRKLALIHVMLQEREVVRGSR